MQSHQIKGCLYGMALGDALGAKTEFTAYKRLVSQYPHITMLELQGNPALVTDDTQMALAVGEALMDVSLPYQPDSLAEAFRQYFIRWAESPDNNRAPGMTCMGSVRRMNNGLNWRQATNINSKGCGANMRVQPVGLLPVDAVTRAAIAQLQAAITHGHPTGLAAADLTAYTIADLAQGGSVGGLVDRLIAYGESQRTLYHVDWLGDIWKRSDLARNPQDFIAYGWDECLAILQQVQDAMIAPNPDADPCLVIGQSWIAEEAFGTALYCFLLFSDDAVLTMQRAAISNGDSDSIACIAGAFVGAYLGYDALPDAWCQRIEYRERLDTLAEHLNYLNR